VSTFLNFTIVGIVYGAIYAIVASGLVVTYTTSGIFNFAHGAIGMLMAFTYWELRVHRHVPAPIALFLVLFVIAPLFGALIERVLMRNLSASNTGAALVVTLGLLVVLLYGVPVIWSSSTSRHLPEFFNGHSVKIGAVRVSWGQFITIGLAGAVAIGLRLLFYRTRAGITMRAVVDDRDLTALNGAPPARVSQLSWALGASMAGLAGILIAPGVGLEPLGLTFLVVNGYAAAMVGRLKSLPLTFAGAMGLGLIFEYVIGYVKLTGFKKNLPAEVPTILLFVVLLALPQVRLRVGRLVGGKSPRVPTMRQTLAGCGVLVAVVTLLAQVLSGPNLGQASKGLSISILMLSLVLLTGYGGQVSLCQFSLAGIGAYVFGRMATGGGPLALIAVALICAAVGAVVASFSLRLQGLYLALSTLAFAALADFQFFKIKLSLGSLKVHRLSVPGVSLAGNRVNLVVLAVVFSLFAILVLAIRRGPFGRLLSAMSDSPAACATLGLDLTLTKLAVFALSAAMAGVAGAFYGGSQNIVTANDFNYIQSLIILLLVYVGGVNTVTGALLGGSLYALGNIASPHLPQAIQQLTPLGTGLGAITIGRNANGIAGQLSDAFGSVKARFGAGPSPGRETAGALAFAPEGGPIATAN
jgi:branched-chain amino acid transport system permease protein